LPFPRVALAWGMMGYSRKIWLENFEFFFQEVDIQKIFLQLFFRVKIDVMLYVLIA
jgi:hypothetical protein